ncbi:LANO_0C03246g1_1 [Lachancea nothofagi CBS 11611]|uniref:LANO_0C03246g1_1 n=1 Tax=Lachancea nothofagi CBS 11611 TaxID=1266666 RepID=A0A1G4J5G8_9SACH|nr:LANO_0C03246g1_1 [Lachancea nothofagi CBS 11611]
MNLSIENRSQNLEMTSTQHEISSANLGGSERTDYFGLQEKASPGYGSERNYGVGGRRRGAEYAKRYLEEHQAKKDSEGMKRTMVDVVKSQAICPMAIREHGSPEIVHTNAYALDSDSESCIDYDSCIEYDSDNTCCNFSRREFIHTPSDGEISSNNSSFLKDSEVAHQKSKRCGQSKKHCYRSQSQRTKCASSCPSEIIFEDTSGKRKEPIEISFQVKHKERPVDSAQLLPSDDKIQRLPKTPIPRTPGGMDTIISHKVSYDTQALENNIEERYNGGKNFELKLKESAMFDRRKRKDSGSGSRQISNS